MPDAASLNATDVIEALARCVQITLTDHIIREFLDRTDPAYVRQAQVALELEATMSHAELKIIANFDDVPDEVTLAAIHEAYQDIDLADEEDQD